MPLNFDFIGDFFEAFERIFYVPFRLLFFVLFFFFLFCYFYLFGFFWPGLPLKFFKLLVTLVVLRLLRDYLLTLKHNSFISWIESAPLRKLKIAT